MLTFDKIRDLERVEKKEKILQPLPNDLYAELHEYLARKQQLHEQTDAQELETIKNAIQNFFDERERKLLRSAAEFVQNGLPPKNMTAIEKDFFLEISGLLAHHRKTRSDMIFNGKEQHVEATQTPAPISHDVPQTTTKHTAYRVKTDILPFVGPDLQVYTLKKGDLAELPQPLNDLLLNEGILEIVEIRDSDENSEKSKKILS
ncbi:MAG: DNA replication complex GINS family protein [Candidatus Aenigmarchaeota archaeon]|nr:DNA replication complex GINS family protein [Candidatus Aenigmarchaeota archaeon]